MKLCDVSTHIGSWPFRKLEFTEVEELIKKMDKLNIAKAAVCNTHSILYKNSQRGNEELFEDVKKYPDRLFGVATLNPLYIKARQDLEICARDFGFKALRLVPAYHNYSLNCPEAVEFAAAAGELGMALVVPNRIVDMRQRHWLDVEVNIELDEVIALSTALADVKIIATEFVLSPTENTVKKLKEAPNILFGISRIHTLWPRALGELIAALGRNRFLFASGMGFKVCENSLLRLAMLTESEDIECVGEENFVSIFCSD